MAKTFLEAQWRKLALANYVVDKSVLMRYLPEKTELDLWKDRCYVSLVGFMFLDTRIKGFKVPFHINFEEVNLRFYVKYQDKEESKRGVVFVREIVRKPALAFVANTVYNENYETMPMRNSSKTIGNDLTVEYGWKKNTWNSFAITVVNRAEAIANDSEEEFITEHFWGYTKLKGGRTAEYGVEHPRWEVYPTNDYSIDVDFANVYGRDFGFLTLERPASVFLAEGSEVSVKVGRTI